MSVCNKDIVCLGDFCTCKDIDLSIDGLPTGDYTMYALFNGVKLSKTVTSTTAGEITIPNIFNENYVNFITLVDNNNAVFNDTTYAIRTIPCVGATIPDVPSITNSNIITMLSSAGSTIVNAMLVGRNVAAIIIDDYSKNIGFTKNILDNFITFTDGTILVEGQSLTIFLR